MPAKRKKKKAKAARKTPATALKRIKALIRNKPPFLDERLAPDVDHKLLLALVRQELPERTARAVHRFILSFKSWNDAYCELIVREFRAAQGGSAQSY